MFTGIITAIGTIAALQPRGGDMRLRIATGKLDLSDVQLGDSIAVSGVCLTAVELPGDGFWADASRETLELTILGEIAPGMQVNLEKALTPTTRLGGPRLRQSLRIASPMKPGGAHARQLHRGRGLDRHFHELRRCAGIL